MLERVLKSVLAIATLVYLGMMAFLYFAQSGIVFVPDAPDRKLVASPKQAGLAFEEVNLLTSDNIKLHAWYVAGRNNKPVVLFFHGNAGNISHRIGTIAMLNSLGLNVLVFDYRGYGKSNGSASEQGTYLDARAAWDYLLQTKNFRPQNIVIFGRSMGGAVAANLATEVKAGAVILESTFTSVPDMAAELYPWLPVYMLVRIRYDNLEKIKAIKSPIMVLHSREDEIIPFRHGKALFIAANDPKIFFFLKSSHNDSYRATPGYDLAIAKFISGHIIPATVGTAK